MATFVLIDKNRIRPALNTQVIKADDATVVLDAQRTLEEARLRADEIVKSAEDAFQAEKQRGFLKGVQEARQKMAQDIASSALRTEQHYQSIKSQTIELVMAVVRKVLGDMDVRSLVVAQVTEALKSVKGGKRLTIKVNPTVAGTLRENLSRINIDAAERAIIEVETADHLAPDDLVLEGETGVVDASMSVQLNAIEKGFRAACDLGEAGDP